MLHVTGGYDDDDRSDDILEAQGGRWRKVATLTNGSNGRLLQGVSIVNFNDFAEYCKN